MWLSRERYDQLLTQLAKAEHQAVVSSDALATARRAHTTQLREAMRRVRVAEQRESRIADSLDIEHAENRKAERHWANMFLRMKQTGAFPLQSTTPAREIPGPDGAVLEPVIDDGEVDGLLAVAPSGMTRSEIVEFLRKEKGLPPL